MYPVTALFFDLDGTLVDTLPDIARAVNRLRRENGRSRLNFEQVQAIVGDGARKLVLRAAAAAGVVSCFCNYGYGHADGLPATARIGKPLELLTYFS